MCADILPLNIFDRAQQPRLWTRVTVITTTAVLVGALLACASGGRPGNSSAPAKAMTVPASGSTSATSGAAETAHARVGKLTITGGYIPQPASPDVAAAYLRIANAASSPDRLISVTTKSSRSVMPMTESDSGGTGSMKNLMKITIPSRGTFEFVPDHAHLMLENPTSPLRQGDVVTMKLHFAHAGTVKLHMPVVGVTGPTGGASMPSMSGMSMPDGS